MNILGTLGILTLVTLSTMSSTSSTFEGYFQLDPYSLASFSDPPPFGQQKLFPKFFLANEKYLAAVTIINDKPASYLVQLVDSQNLQPVPNAFWYFNKTTEFSTITLIGPNSDKTVFFVYFLDAQDSSLTALTETGNVLWNQPFHYTYWSFYTIIYDPKKDIIHQILGGKYMQISGKTGIIVLSNTASPEISDKVFKMQFIGPVSGNIFILIEDTTNQVISTQNGKVLFIRNITGFGKLPSEPYATIDAQGIMTSEEILIISISRYSTVRLRVTIAFNGLTGAEIWRRSMTWTSEEDDFFGMERFTQTFDPKIVIVSDNSNIGLLKVDSGNIISSLRTDTFYGNIFTIGTKFLFAVRKSNAITAEEFAFLYIVNISDPLILSPPLQIKGEFWIDFIGASSIYGELDENPVRLISTQNPPFPIANLSAPPIIVQNIPTQNQPISLGLILGISCLSLVIFSFCGCCCCCCNKSSNPYQLVGGTNRKNICTKRILLCSIIYTIFVLGVCIAFLVIPIVLAGSPIGITLKNDDQKLYQVGDIVNITIDVQNPKSPSFSLNCYLFLPLTHYPNFTSSIPFQNNIVQFIIPTDSVEFDITCQYNYFFTFIQPTVSDVALQICQLLYGNSCRVFTTLTTKLQTFQFSPKTVVLPPNVEYSTQFGKSAILLNLRSPMIDGIWYGSVLLHPDFLFEVLDIIGTNSSTTTLLVNYTSFESVYQELHLSNYSENANTFTSKNGKLTTNSVTKREINEWDGISITFSKREVQIPFPNINVVSSTYKFSGGKWICTHKLNMDISSGIFQQGGQVFRCDFGYNVMIDLSILEKVKIKVEKELSSGEMPLILGYYANGKVIAAIIASVSIDVERAITISAGSNYEGYIEVIINFPSLMNPGSVEKNFVPGIPKFYFNNTSDELCQAHIDLSLGLDVQYFPLGKNPVFSPGLGFRFARHYWKDQWTPDPDPDLLAPKSEEKHEIIFESCPCGENVLCPSLIGISQGGTLAAELTWSFLSRYSSGLSKEFWYFDQSIFSQGCKQLPCSPHFLCDKSTLLPKCVTTNATNAMYNSQCKESCVARYTCDESTYQCKLDNSGKFTKLSDCTSYCIPPNWFGCPCRPGTICCVCPQAPFPCSGACALSNECYPKGKDCCLGL